jgi:hypothetical protein
MAFGKWQKYRRKMNVMSLPSVINSLKREGLSKFVRQQRIGANGHGIRRLL